MFNVTHDFRIKCSVQNEYSSFSKHQRLGHISKERIMRLVKSKISLHLDFTNMDVSMDCIKGKQKNHTSKHPAT